MVRELETWERVYLGQERDTILPPEFKDIFDHSLKMVLDCTTPLMNNSTLNMREGGKEGEKERMLREYCFGAFWEVFSSNTGIFKVVEIFMEIPITLMLYFSAKIK